MNQTFTEFKSGFYGRIKDFTLFDCGDINLFKVVLSGLFVDYISHGKIRTPLFYAKPLLSIFLFMQRLRYRNFTQFTVLQHSPETIFFDTGRITTGNNDKSLLYYYDNIIRLYGRDKCLVIVQKRKAPDVDVDYVYEELLPSFAFSPLTSQDFAMREQLINTFRRVSDSRIFTAEELQNIKIAIQMFFDQFRFFYGIMKQYPILKKAHFDGHYHREGMMYALKKLHIKAHELQHGLIAPEDIFYVFPKVIAPVRDKALFPDKIYVYGQYWKEVLLKGCEFDENSVSIIGNYPVNYSFEDAQTKKTMQEMKKDAELILIATQTTAHLLFIAYIQFLSTYISDNKLQYKIIVKPHPNENIQLYDSLTLLSNVSVVNTNVNIIFNYVKYQISIYSTTFFDALKYNSSIQNQNPTAGYIGNYALNVDIYRDYVETTVNAGVATKLELNQTPFDVPASVKSFSPEYFYAPPDYDVLKQE